LYEGREEEAFFEKRPIILNGIGDIVSRPDLVDRAIFLTLEKIGTKERKREAKMEAAFNLEAPGIMGALCDGLSCGLKNLQDIEIEELPRMADFAFWVSACETAFWEKGTFMAAYTKNRGNAEGLVLEADVVAQAILRMLRDDPLEKPHYEQNQGIGTKATNGVWFGTPENLLRSLTPYADTRSKFWPGTPQSLGIRLRRIETALMSAGILVEHDRSNERNRTRTIKIKDTNYCTVVTEKIQKPNLVLVPGEVKKSNPYYGEQKPNPFVVPEATKAEGILLKLINKEF
jgi:hypothetical protein